MKIIENITQYQCDFCSKKLYVKGAMLNHEKICASNPLNFKKCTIGCKHLTTIDKDVWFENIHYHPDCNEEGRYENVKVFKCSLFDKLMFPYSIEVKNRHNIYPETYEDQEPMPKECEGFELNNEFDI